MLSPESDRVKALPITQSIETLEFLHPDGAVFELCIIGPQAPTSSLWAGRAFGKKPIVAGWFQDPGKAAHLAVQIKSEGIYITLNPCQEALIARADHRLKAGVNRTKDQEIEKIQNLLFDLDPIRPEGISSTDQEHEAALEMAQIINAELAKEGWPEPLVGDSGNGGHLVYPLDLPNTQESIDLVKAVLEALALRCADELKSKNLEIDLKVFNPARLTKLYGTTTRKGDNTETRPHRMAQIISLPQARHPVLLELLQKLAATVQSQGAQAKTKEPGTNEGQFDVEGYLKHYRVEVVKAKPHRGGMLYCLQECLFDSYHGDNEAAVGQAADGKLYYQCFHKSCKNRTWQEARAKISGADKLTEFMIGSTHRYGQKTGPAESTAGCEGTAGAQDEASKLAEESLGLPVIQVNNRQLRDTTREAIAALHAANNPPEIFVRMGQLCRIQVDEDGRPLIEMLTEASLRYHLALAADFIRENKELMTRISPPRDLVQNTLASGSWPFPPLRGIVEVPVLRADGSILGRPGYDPATRLFYRPMPGLALPDISEKPCQEDATRAANFIHQELLHDFPFADDASRANIFAALLTPLVRHAIPGPVPIAVKDAPQAGTGKTMLQDIVAMIAIGRGGPMLSPPMRRDSDEEWSKVITSALLKGSMIIIFDNCDGLLRSPSLAMAVTARIYGARILGSNRQVEMPINVSWYMNGNNIQLGGDLPRRCYWIRLDARMSRPWKRTDFKHKNLISWVMENRGKLIVALLTMARAWFVAGRPEPDCPVLGSFEAWCRTLGGILQFAGVRGFLGNLEEMYEKADMEGQEWEAFLLAWRERYGATVVLVKDLVKELGEEESPLRDAMPSQLAEAHAKKGGSLARTLGWALGKKEGVYFGDAGVHLERVANADHRTGANGWRVAAYGSA